MDLGNVRKLLWYFVTIVWVRNKMLYFSYIFMVGEPSVHGTWPVKYTSEKLRSSEKIQIWKVWSIKTYENNSRWKIQHHKGIF